MIILDISRGKDSMRLGNLLDVETETHRDWEICWMSRPRLIETWKLARCRDRDSSRLGNLLDVETETSRDWTKDVDTETPSRLSLISVPLFMLGSRVLDTLFSIREGFNKKNNKFYGIFQIGWAPPPPPPYFGKLLRMTRCFDLWRLKIRGVTFNDSLLWSGEVEGGS